MTDREKIIDLRQKGWTPGQIATHLGLSIKLVLKGIETAMVELRDGAPIMIEEAFNLQVNRLEALVRKMQEEIDRMTEFNAEVFKVYLSIMERQAKLLGLDKSTKKSQTKVGKSGRADNWLDDATPAELIYESEQYGAQVPEKFKL